MDEIEEKIQSIDDDLKFNIYGDEIVVLHPEHDFEKFFYANEVDNEQLVNDIRDFLGIKFLDNKGLYKEDYYEVLVNISNSLWLDTLTHYQFSLNNSTNSHEKISYEITVLSSELQEYLEGTISEMYAEDLMSLKIYNIDSVLKLQEDDNRLEIADNIAKSIIFEIVQKTTLELEISEVNRPEHDPHYESIEEAKEITKTILERTYDKDLIGYFYRALQMATSEFKYLAFYQVIECLFDEVYLAETIEDTRRIIDASHFSTSNDDDLKGLIELIGRYNNEKNDRSKTRLVLEKYFKGEIHKEAYLIANKELIEILKTDLEKIDKEEQAWDIQRLANIIYDFRCECTHSNRAYPIDREFKKTDDELISYIKVIRKITAAVIKNYKKNKMDL